MNKTIILAAAAAAFTTAAYAQDMQNAKSSLALYGILDTAVTYRTNINNNQEWVIRSGITQSNFGLRGVENIGNGLKAIFLLESGLNISNGKVDDTNHSSFNREAYVGLSSNAGTLLVGRQHGSIQDYLSPISSTGSWGGMHFSHIKNRDFLFKSASILLDNTVKFTSRDYSGLRFGATYSFPNRESEKKTSYSAGVSYQCQDLRLAASYIKLDRKEDKDNSALNGYIYGVGTTYNLGIGRIGALWTQSFKDLPNNSLGYKRLDTYEVNARYNLSPDLAVSASYSYMHLTREKGNNPSSWNQVGVQTDYMLSKRTGLYAQVQYQNLNKESKSTSFIYEDYDGLSKIEGMNKNNFLAAFGIRHSF
ncbi:MAG: porin [Burkholderia sp.]|nr:porin [Burkholderia sp.]